MLKIGAHMSIAEGYAKAAENALDIGANTFQFFTRNPRGGAAKPLEDDDVEKLKTYLNENEFSLLLAHCPYTVNMASDKEEVRRGARELMRFDLDLLAKLPCKLYNVHPGSRKKDTPEQGVERIVAAVNDVLREDDDIFFLFETMSGKGGEMGRSFDEIAEITDGIKLKDKIGVCLDTCHVYCAGYDIKNDLDGVLTEFDKIVGLERLKAVHMNDTVNDFATHKDHHARLGEGYLGKDIFVRMINHEALKDLPFFLETPNDLAGYKEEIDFLKENYKW